MRTKSQLLLELLVANYPGWTNYKQLALITPRYGSRFFEFKQANILIQKRKTIDGGFEYRLGFAPEFVDIENARGLVRGADMFGKILPQSKPKRKRDQAQLDIF